MSQKQTWQNWCDEFFAYDTVKIVRVLDSRVGVFHIVCRAFIGIYVICYVFLVSKKYVEEEKVQGWVVVNVRNPQYDQDGVPWDLFERWINPGENGAVFIPTRIDITKGQTQNDQFCESLKPEHKCSKNEDCDIRNEDVQKAECVNGHCMRRQWCPAEDPDSPTTETHYLEFDKVELRFQSYTLFSKFKLYAATSDEGEWIKYPDERANTYRLTDLVEWAGKKPIDITERGAVMMVNLAILSPRANPAEWLSERRVIQTAESYMVDTETGYNFVHNMDYDEGGVRKRDSYRMFGIRLMGFVTGFAEKITLSGIVIQVASALALMTFAEMFTDMYLVSPLVPEREHYKRYKVKETEDFHND